MILRFLKLLVASLLFIAYFDSVQAQNQNMIDSLLQVLYTSKEDTNKVNTQLILSEQYYRSGDQDNENKYANNALHLAKQINYKKGEAKACHAIGDVYSQQGNNAEALKFYTASMKINEEIRNEKGLADVFKSIGNLYRKQGDFTEALKNLLKALKIAEEIDDRQFIAKVYNGIGNVYYSQSNYPEALKNHFASMKIFEEIGFKEGMGASYGNIANIYVFQGNYPEGLKYNFASLKIFQDLGKKEGISNCYNNIALIYSYQENYVEALKYLLSALNIKEEIGDKHGASNCYLNIGELYGVLGNYPESLKYFFTALKIKQEIGDKAGIAGCHEGLGNTYNKQGDFTNALNMYFIALKMYEESGDLRSIASSFNNIGNIYSKKRQYPEAIDNLNKSLRIATENGFKEIVKEDYNTLSNVYKHMNDWKNAFKFQTLYFQVYDSLFNEAKSQQITEMKTKYESENKEKEIALLTKDKEIQNVALKKQTVLKNSFIGGLTLTLILFFFIYNNYRTRQKLKLENIRNNIAADLHDDIGSTLNSISLFSEVAKKEAGKEMPALEQIGISSRKIIDAMSDIVWTINPENDTLENVISRMRSLAYLLLKAKGIDFVFKADEGLNELSLPMLARKNIYLLFKEATNNIVKYSGAERASFHISLVNKHVKMTIKDNGVGFDMESARNGGNGIKNMKRRAMEIGGQFIMESTEGTGTNIELSFKV